MSTQEMLLNDYLLDVELRQPRIDPRKGRRHCLNFGFAREDDEDSPPTILAHDSTNLSQVNSDDNISSSLPSPIGTYSDIGSESDFASLQDIEMEFPQPPSISPMLRRMRSSPSFAEAAHLFRHVPPQPNAVGPPNSFSKHMSELSSPSPTHLNFGGRTNGLSKALENVEDSPRSSWTRRNSVAGREKTHRLSRTEPNLSPRLRCQSIQSIAPPQDNNLTVFHPEDIAATPKANRRRSSTVVPSAASRTIHKMRSLKFRSTDVPPRLENKDKPSRSLLKGRSVSMEFVRGGGSTLPSTSGLSFLAARQKPRPNPTSFVSTGGDGKHKRRTSFQPEKPRAHFEHEKGGLMSFMDITPEHRTSSKQGQPSKDRVRRLWLKASSSIVEWGKGLSRKPVQ